MKTVAIIVFILAVVALTVYLFLSRGISYERGPVDTPPVTESSPEFSTAPYDPTTAATIPTDGWLTYTDAEAGFSFRYPPSHVVGKMFGQGEDQYVYMFRIEPSTAPEPQESDAKDAVNRVGIGVSKQRAEETVNAYRLNDIIEGLQVKEITLNGLSGYLVIHQYPPTGEYRNDILVTLPSNDTLSIYYSNRIVSDDVYPSMVVPNTIFDTVLQSVSPIY